MTPTLTIIVSYFAYNLFLLATASFIGMACVVAIQKHSRTQQRFPAFTFFLYSVATGFTFVITLLFILALCGYLTKTVIFSALGLSASCAIIYSATQVAFFRQYITHPYEDSFNNTLYYFSLSATILIALFTLLTNIHPTNFADATAYHLPYAQFYLDHSGLAVDTQLRFPYHSHNGNLLYSFALTFADSIYCQTLQNMFGILIALIMFSLAISAGITAPLAMLASVAFLSLKFFTNLSQVANVDLFAAYFVTMSAYALCVWRQNRADLVSFIVSALCLGMAMGTKYIEALHALPIAVFIIYQSRALRPLFFYASITALFGLWWHIRSWVMIGNPVHPFAPEIFGYSFWNKADYAQQMQDLSGFIEKTFVHFVTLPRLFNVGQLEFTGMQNWVYGFYLAPLFWTRLSSSSKALMLICWPFLAFWFFTSQTWRYIIPLAPLMMLVCFDILQIMFNQLYALISKLNKTELTLASLQPVITGLIIAFILQRATLLIGQVRMASAQALTPAAQDVYLARYNKEYELISIANRHFAKGNNIYLFSFYDKTYFVKANVFGEHFGPYRIRDFSALVIAASDKNHPDSAAFKSLTDRFAAMQLDGFIMDNNIPYDQALFDREFQRLYSNAAGTVYRIKH